MHTPEALIRFDSLRERLIQGGVARRHVKRTLTELHDHYDDALDDGLAQGLSREAAAEAAWQRLGAEDEIVGNVLARPELQSLPARYPRAVFGAGPVALWFAITALSILLIMAITKAFQLAGLLPMPGKATHIEPMWLQSLGHALMFTYMRILPVIIGAIIAVMAARHRLVPRWTAAGAFVVSLLSAFATWALIFPTIPGEPGELQLGFGVAANELPRSLALAAMNAGLILAAYWFALRLRRSK